MNKKLCSLTLLVLFHPTSFLRKLVVASSIWEVAFSVIADDCTPHSAPTTVTFSKLPLLV